MANNMKVQMVDMALSQKEMAEESSDGMQPSQYPMGLCIRLEQEELDKLGIMQLPQVGEEYHIMAVGIVQNLSQQDGENCMGIQITHLALMDEPRPQMQGEDENSEMVQPKAPQKIRSTVLSY